MGSRILIYLLTVVLFAHVFLYIYIRGSSPLVIQKIIHMNASSDRNIILTLENDGSREIKLLEVSINDSVKSDIRVSHSLSSLQETADNQPVISEGYLLIKSEEPIKSVYIKYKSYGMIFIKEINIDSLKIEELRE